MAWDGGGGRAGEGWFGSVRNRYGARTTVRRRRRVPRRGPARHGFPLTSRGFRCLGIGGSETEDMRNERKATTKATTTFPFCSLATHATVRVAAMPPRKRMRTRLRATKFDDLPEDVQLEILRLALFEDADADEKTRKNALRVECLKRPAVVPTRTQETPRPRTKKHYARHRRGCYRRASVHRIERVPNPGETREALGGASRSFSGSVRARLPGKSGWALRRRQEGQGRKGRHAPVG